MQQDLSEQEQELKFDQDSVNSFLYSKQWKFSETSEKSLCYILNYLQHQTQSSCQKISIHKIHVLPSQIAFRLIKCLQNICFTHLELLLMNGFQITNIQFLTKMDCRFLKRVFLYMNSKISKFQKSIRKCTFPCLEIMNIQNNRILQANKLSEFYIQQFFESIIIEMGGSSINQIQDLSFCCKLQIKSLQRLRISNYVRISQLNLTAMFKNKRFTRKSLTIFQEKRVF